MIIVTLSDRNKILYDAIDSLDPMSRDILAVKFPDENGEWARARNNIKTKYQVTLQEVDLARSIIKGKLQRELAMRGLRNLDDCLDVIPD